MATKNQRDVKLVLSVETLGEDGIGKIEQSIRQLAQQGGNAAPEFERLADEVARIGNQSAALETFRELAVQTERLAAEQASAAVTTETLRGKLQDAHTAAVAAGESQRAAGRAYDENKKQIEQYKTALANLKIEYNAGRVSQEQFVADALRLNTAMGEARASTVTLRTERAAATKEATTLAAAERKLEAQYVTSLKSQEGLARAYKESATGMERSADAARALGVSTESVAASQAQLLQNLNGLGTQARSAADRMQELAQAEERAAQATREHAAASEDALSVLQREVAATLELEQSFEQMTGSLRAHVAAQEQAAAAAAEMAEHNRLLRIQQEAMNALHREGADALHAEQAALREAAQNSNLYVAAKRQEAAASEAAATASKQSADAIRNAFETVGIRSAQELQQEIVEVRLAMETIRTTAGVTGQALAGAFAAGERKINDIQREIREVTNAMTLGDRAAKLFSNSLGQITAGNLIADGVGFLVQRVKDLGVSFFTTNLEIQRLERALTQVYGSSEVAGKQIGFLRQQADTSGTSVGALSDAFVRFSAATRSSGIGMETVNALFAATTRAAGTLGLTNEQVTGTLEALGQMASKGTVSLEELRQQLGDRLPGAISIAASGLGLTEEKLIKLIETGNLTAKQFFPAFTKGLEQAFGEGGKRVEGFMASWNRLVNAITTRSQELSNTDFFKTLGTGIDAFTANIDSAITAVKLLGQTYLVLKTIDIAKSFYTNVTASKASATAITEETVATQTNTAAKNANTAAQLANATAQRNVAAATTATAVAQTANAAAWQGLAGSLSTSTKAYEQHAQQLQRVDGSLKLVTATKTTAAGAAGRLAGAWGALGSVAGALGTGIRSLAGVFGGLPGVFALAVLNSRELGTWIGELIGKYSAAGTKMKEYEAAMAAQAAKEQEAIRTKRELQVEQDKINLRNVEAATAARKAADAAVDAAEKAVKAKEQEVEVSEKFASILGDETEALRVSAAASEAKLGQQKRLSDASAEYVSTIEEEIRVIERTQDANGKLTDKQTEQMTKLKELLAVKREEAANDRDKLRGLELEVIQRQLLSEAARDNTGRIQELAQAYDNARAKAQALVGSGVASMDQIRLANAEAAKAANLLSKAFEQQAEKIKLKSEVEKSSISITQSRVTVEQASYEQMAASARESGRYAEATYYEITAKQKAIQAVQLSTQAKKIEAQADIDAAIASRRSLEATGLLTDEKKREIEVRLNNAKAKMAEAQASESQVRALEQEIQNLIRGKNSRQDVTKATEEQTEAMDRLLMRYTLSANYSERQIALLEKERVAQEKLKEAEDKRLNRDKEGFSLNTGGQRVVQGIENRTSVYQRAKGSGLTDAQALEIAERFIGPTGAMTGYANADPRKGENWQTELQKSIDRLVLQNAEAAARQSKLSSTQQTGSGSNVVGTYQPIKRNEVAPATPVSAQTRVRLDDGRTITKTTPDENVDLQFLTQQAEAQEALRERLVALEDGSFITKEKADAYLNPPANYKPTMADVEQGIASSRTVNITINGQRTRVGVASEQDGDNLISMLRQLESAANAAY